MNPLAVEIWLFLLLAYVLVSLCMWVVARFTPYEWHEVGGPGRCHHCHQLMNANNHHNNGVNHHHQVADVMMMMIANEPHHPGTGPVQPSTNGSIVNDFSLANSFWFTIGTLMQQGSDLNPKVSYYTFDQWISLQRGPFWFPHY